MFVSLTLILCYFHIYCLLVTVFAFHIFSISPIVYGDQAEFCIRGGMWAIVKKYLYPVHKNKLDLRDFFSYIRFPNFLLSSLYLELFSNLLSFSYRFYLPYVLDLSKCVKVTEFCSQKGMRAIAVLRNSNTKYVNLICHKLVCTFHKSKLASRKLFPYIPVLNLQFSLNFTESVKYKYRMKFIDVLETV